MGVSGHHVPVWYDEATGPEPGQGVFWNPTTRRFEAANVDVSALDTSGLATDAELAAGLATKQDSIPPGTYVDTTTAQTKAGALTLRDMLYLRPATTLTQIEGKPLGSGVDAPIELVHNDTQSYLLHLICGPTMGNPLTDGAALIGMGVDNAGVGLFVNNKKTGIGIKVTQNSTITSTTGYGILVNGGPGAAPAVFMQQNNVAGSLNAQPLLVLHAYQSFNASQKIMEWRKPNGTTSGALVGYIKAEDGALVQGGAMTVSGGDFTAQAASGVGGNIKGVSLLSQGDGAYVGLYDTLGTADSRRFRFSQSAGFLVLSARNDDGTSKAQLLTVSQGGDISATTLGAAAAGAYLDLYDTGGTSNSRRFRINQGSGILQFLARNDDGTAKATLFSVTQAGVLTATGGIAATTVSAAGTGAYLDFQDNAFTADQRRWRISQSSGSLLIGLRTDAGATVRNPLTISGSTGSVTLLDAANIVIGSTTGTKIGTATTQKLGLWNATPVVQPTGIADVTGGSTVDAEVRTAFNSLLAKLESVGLLAVA